MKKLDLYIIKKFIGTFFLALTLIILIAIIFDISEKMDDFIDKEAPLKAIVFDYYFNFIPYFANLFSALFVFISVIFFTSRMAAKTEFIAMFASGISVRRLLLPYFLVAFLITSFSFALGNYVIPDANKQRFEFQNKYFKRSMNSITSGMSHRQIYPGVYFYVENFNRNTNMGINMSLEKFDGVVLKSKLNAQTMIWDSISDSWIVQNYVMRNFIDGREELIIGNRIDTAFRIKPDDFIMRNNIVEEMSVKELNEYISEQKLSGTSAVVLSEIEKHNRIASPFSSFILTLIGFGLSIKKSRGGLGFNIGLGLLLSFSYILFMRFASVFAISGYFSAALSAWIPNILYFFIAIGIYIKTLK
ncbi:MAG: YjgP/YjgQ family permease [Bacteroidales bacterium]|nr:LptF/LptG family permease [Bacteroidales bacterium]MCK9498040.1 LptF/LptG family permease [Bacteroidales bacterium]MDY0314234.1 LptF/LptG family permease [Bacteroidales bacterium]NLB85433.1 YjgP/YjgQ family permease [Bacteroidales bacterium]